MIDYELQIVAPQAENWGAFHCGDPRIDRKLRLQIQWAKLGLVRLHGLYVADQLQGVLTLQAGVLQAPREVISSFGPVDSVPALHIEVLAVRDSAQGRGYGRILIEHAILHALTVSATVGLKTLSLEATPESAAFYARLGFNQASAPWPDGSLPMWFTLD